MGTTLCFKRSTENNIYSIYDPNEIKPLNQGSSTKEEIATVLILLKQGV